MLEELKQVADLLNTLGAGAYSAFIWYMVFDLVKAILPYLVLLACVYVFAKGVAYNINRDNEKEYKELKAKFKKGE